jgi:undecaprenyl-diphosphatase
MRSPSLARLDEALLTWIVGHRVQPLDGLFRRLSGLGRGGLFSSGLVFGLAARRTGSLSSAALWALPVPTAYLGSIALSRLIGRARPCQRGLAEPLSPCPSGPSLPSDQAAAAFAALVLSLYLRPGVGLGLGAIAVASGASRVYVGLHFPGDVVAGAGLGSLCARAAVPILRVREGLPSPR